MPDQEYLVVEHFNRKQLARIFSKIKIDPATQCWEWQGPRDKQGYGKAHWKNKIEVAHRLIYAWAVGPIPRMIIGQKTPQIDHIVCDNPKCCNPSHLALVAPRQNSTRSVKSVAGINSRKTHCDYGHELPPHPTGKTKGRYCSECKRNQPARMTPEQKARRKLTSAKYYQRRRNGPDGKAFIQRRAEALIRWKERQYQQGHSITSQSSLK